MTFNYEWIVLLSLVFEVMFNLDLRIFSQNLATVNKLF